MQLQTIDLFSWTDDSNAGPVLTRVVRHTIVQPNGLMYYQDEYLKHYTDTHAISSERTPWNMIPPPPVPDEPVGTFEYAGLFGAVMRSGKAYIFAAKVPDPDDEDAKIAFDIYQRSHRIHEWPHEWVSFANALPETLANAVAKA